MHTVNPVVSFAEKVRQESDELKNDYAIFEPNSLDDFEQRDREQLEFLCWSYGLKTPSYEDFKAFLEAPVIQDLKYARNEYMILYISMYKAAFQRDTVSDKRITFLKFCISKDIFFTEALFRDYLDWSEETCAESGLSRWQKMEEYYLTTII